MKQATSQQNARIAFVVPRRIRAELMAWAKEEDRTTANLVYSLVRQAVEKREQQRADLRRKELFHDEG
ncbi:MAG: hypothetical protein KME04_14160 [Pleurocapsa minor GSE-CHR-MK-17-07R]|nr:hypothetical protein [Pleurocapsa minor GSE-CHR-MK 17-07R]